MVLFKRKPVSYVPKPPILEDQEIWIIEATEEIFTNYNDYLARIEHYKQKRFICEVTGHSGMDFFTAQKNEVEASHEVDDSFPDALREPIMRKVQFSTISRIDNLVDHIFEEFKQDFYPGESVTVHLNNGDRFMGIVREKAKFPELVNPIDGTVERAAFARYFVKIIDQPNNEALVDTKHIHRDRKVFTKQMLRSFIRNSVHRETWTGAPWLVKEHIAKEFRISTNIPEHLTYDFQVAQRHQNRTTRKAEANGATWSIINPHGRLPELKPKSHKGKGTQHEMARSRNEQFIEYQRTMNPAGPSNRAFPAPNDPQYIQFVNQNTGFPPIASKGVLKPLGPQGQKFPREDLEVPPLRDALSRPPMKFLSEDTPCVGRPSEGAGSGIQMSSVGLLLETWDTLNVYCEVFALDSFTFDDYVEALQFTSEDVQCELLVEIHCAVLKKLVNDEKDLNGQVQITLPLVPDEMDEEFSTQESNTPTPEPEIKPRTTRGSLAKTEAAELKAAAAVAAKLHRAAEIDQSVKGYGWRFRLRKRDFSNGKWIVIVVGLMNLFTANTRYRKVCDEILIKLAPVNMEATDETAISQYAKLDINLRVKILQFLCMLSLETQAIRGYMEDCTQQMTQHRKDKVEAQRNRKAALEDLRLLQEERKALQPEAAVPIVEVVIEPSEPEQLGEMEDLNMEEPEEDEDQIMESEDEEPVQQRSLRRAIDRAAERKRKLEEERERKEKAEAEKAKRPTKQARQLEKITRKIEDAVERIKEFEDEIATLDNDLREADCPRTRVLGKDRFWNRYYWFERNAMPYAGLPTSSTAHAGYANGMVWVQGPDDLERVGFIELSAEENEQYRTAFRVAVPERKMLQEGQTHTFTAYQWGYYDDPDQIDELIAWLDVRGVRELKLRKEFLAQRDKITIHMKKRTEYLTQHQNKRSESAEPVTRVSTRTKTYIDPSGHRCMDWKNTTALNELGHIHSEPPRGPKKGVARTTTKKALVEDEGRQTRASNRSGKPLSRQGGRYNF